MFHPLLQILERGWHLHLALADAGEVDCEGVALVVKGYHQVVRVVVASQLQFRPQYQVLTPDTCKRQRFSQMLHRAGKYCLAGTANPIKCVLGNQKQRGGEGGMLQTSTDLFCIATKFRGREGLAWRAQRGADERTCSTLLLKQLVKATQPVTSLFQVHLLSASNNNF